MTTPATEPFHAGLVREAYDAGAAELAARFPAVGAEAPLDLAMVEAFVQSVPTGEDSRVLDAGCGGGRMSRHLADLGCQVRGLDLSEGMVRAARRDHPDLMFVVGSLADLPCADGEFAGVLLWYSIIHTRPAGLARVAAEVRRVLRPGGHVLVGFQSGEGTRDVAWAYERGIRLDRYLYTAEDLAFAFQAAGLREIARLVRRARAHERDDQAFLLLRAGTVASA